MSSKTKLFSPITLRGHEIRNRIGISPMCQYSSTDGFATDWHMAHIGSRATGGAGLIIMEATAVAAIGRISPGDLGIWQDGHIAKLKEIVAFGKSQGAVMGIQLAHAGRKASCAKPWEGGQPLMTAPEGGWQVIAPSAIPFKSGHPMPLEMTQAHIDNLVAQFIAGAQRAVAAGFDLIEIHGAHGYLIHSFLSALSNTRTDSYGGSAENRRRLLVDIVKAVRGVIGEDRIMSVRLSCSDWTDGGITIEETVETAKVLKTLGVDIVDCSSGGGVHDAKIPGTTPGYQVPFASAVRKQAGIISAAVGTITQAKQAEDILQAGDADLIFIARASLMDAYWPLHAALELGDKPPVPKQYERGFPRAA